MRAFQIGLIALGLGATVLPARAQNSKAASSQLSPLETQVMGQNRWLRGGPAALRVVVSNHQTGKPVPASVSLTAVPIVDGKPGAYPVLLYQGKTDSLGTLRAQFKAPSWKGATRLTVALATPIGKDEVQQTLQIEESTQLMLTSDKPLYQPGQKMHLRALALDGATRQSVADKPVTFEIEDARGNKVFKKKTTLNKFGIASTDFQLADEVNMGTFTLRAVLPEGETEKKVRVERYVLPKFKVTVTPDKPYYLPGDQVTGQIVAKYFFGKPVSGGEAKITINTVDIGVTKLTELKATLDPLGHYTFRYTLPKSFVGQPLEQGKAVVEFEVSVRDTADHKQEGRTSVPVVQEPVQLVVVPESRALVPGIVNRIFVAAATPDGSAVKNATIRMARQKGFDGNPPPSEATTDELGIAVFEVTPGKQPIQLRFTMNDNKGLRADKTQEIATAQQQEGIILRVDKPLAKVGDRINFAALSSIKGGTLYLDIIRNRQTILTRAEPMRGGQAAITLPATNDMVGTLEVHAYKILPNEEIIRDTRIVVVSPANDLNIAVSADKMEYRPGGEATFKFAVTDNNKRPILAALGVAMVDESVFALSELKPGLEKIYFTLEKELMEPKYEIHGLRPTGLIEPPRPIPPRPLPRPLPIELARQRAATVVLAAAEPKADFDFRHNTYLARWEKLANEVVQEMQATQNKIMAALNKYYTDTKKQLTADEGLTLLVEKGYLKKSDLQDRWGHPYRVNLFNQKVYNYFALSCAGPDGRWDTSDDLKDISIYGRPGRGRFELRRGRGGVRAENGMEDMAFNAAPMAAGAPVKLMAMKADGGATEGRANKSTPSGAPGGNDAPRVREYFPETMLWVPSLLTNEKGEAELRVPMADSITTWRMSLLANSAAGMLGSTTTGVKVFQDFFVDIDLPVSLTQNDRVELPVAVYNYLQQPQTVALTLKEEPWFELQGDASKSLKMEPNQVKVIYYPIRVKAIGKHALTVTAKGTKLSDAIKRAIEVVPDGKEFRPTINDNLQGKVEKTVFLPERAIKEANTIFVKLYPGTFSQVVEGLDGILRMPNGCFEQTSSTTYPNILVLDYLKANKRANPELQMKAEGYINVGYQRLVTFEVKGGGFSWFGDAPAHQILTAYGLLEFSDMAKVHEVDPALIQRTQTWLASQQKPDGSWEEKSPGIAEGIINRQTGTLRSTAYVAWALAETGYQGAELAKGVSYIKQHRNQARDPYTLAVILNLLTKVERESDYTAQLADELIKMAKVADKTAYWESETQTFTGADRAGADLETTGLAAYGLVKWGRNAGFANKVLTYLVQSKDSFGTWSTTQGTVWAMKALLFASRNSVGGGKGSVTVLANGKPAAKFDITPEDSDVMRQVNLVEFVKPGQNSVTLEYTGDGSLLYQIVGRYYMPWGEVQPPAPEFEPLDLKVEYDKKDLAQEDTATVTVTIHNKTTKIVEMPLIDVGVPPGFTVVADQLEAAVQNKTLSKYTVAARQVILYLKELQPAQTVVLKYQLKAKYPIKARTPLSKAYPYYNPERVATVAPTDITVNK